MAIKKYSKVKFTLRKELIFILAAVVVLVVATILLNLPNEEDKFLCTLKLQRKIVRFGLNKRKNLRLNTC